MRLERLNQDKIRIFLTFDDLVERGINKDDMWQDIPKVHELFNDMMHQAHEELDFAVAGPVAVEVFSLPAQGMVVIVTRGWASKELEQEELEEDLQDFYELEVTLDESDDMMFVFRDFDDVVNVSHKLSPFLEDGGTLYKHGSNYYLLFEELDLEEPVYDLLISLLSEFGEPSTQSKYVLAEYGTTVMPSKAIQTICHHFPL